MITLNASGGSVTFTFSGNSTYLNDGTIEVPVNSLALIIDESDMATFRKAASNDIFVSANIAEFGMTKDELMAWYKENMVGSSGGGGKAIEAGRGISITTGETADTVSFNLPISAGTGSNSIVEGNETVASGDYSHAEGSNTTASGQSSHAEGYYTTASGNCSHAEGLGTTASRNYSHAEGYQTQANNDCSHAEGHQTQANGYYSHAEGDSTVASGNYSHAEGNHTTASTDNAHAEGYYTITNNKSEHASGQLNVSNSASTSFGDSGNTLFSVGNGTFLARHNAFEIRQNGDIYFFDGTNDVKLQDVISNILNRLTTIENNS